MGVSRKRALAGTEGAAPQPNGAGAADQVEESWCDIAWTATIGHCEAIKLHPFVQGLSNGSLPRKAFQFYMMQDSAYLRDYARALAVAASKARTEDAQVFLAEASATAVKVERSLHKGFLAQFGITEEALKLNQKSPTCTAYVNFLNATAHTKPLEVLCAALLPCFWLYMHIGQVIHKEAGNTKDNIYQPWIDMYAGDDFAESVAKMQVICNNLALECNEQQRNEMTSAYQQAAQYEWMFFDAAWKLESWPISASGEVLKT
mmetsp:Transcript_7818/g.14808  ORF Transcript_7818/g.14808 Transcript_7818/m.14808 type:complete len:261 (-) Transcript_7818:2748-3530(-)